MAFYSPSTHTGVTNNKIVNSKINNKKIVALTLDHCSGFFMSEREGNPNPEFVSTNGKKYPCELLYTSGSIQSVIIP